MWGGVRRWGHIVSYQSPIRANKMELLISLHVFRFCGFLQSYSGTPVFSDYWSAGAFGKSVGQASLTEGSSPIVLITHLFQYERDQLSNSMSLEFEQQHRVKFGCEGGSLSSLYDDIQTQNVYIYIYIYMYIYIFIYLYMYT